VTAAGDIEHPPPDLRLDKFLRKQLARPSRAEGKGVKTTAFSFTAGPMVRIRFPPAVSLQTFGPSREELPFVQQPAAALYAPVQPDRSVGAVAVQRFRPAGLPSPTTERVDELRNQKRSDRGYGGVRILFVDRQFSVRQQS